MACFHTTLTAPPRIVLLPFHRKGVTLLLERVVQLTPSADHQHYHPLHMGNIPPNARAHHSYSFIDSRAPRSAAALSVECLYVDFFRSALHLPRFTDQCVLCGWVDRLENEHIGNMDQYRVTREVPLPYSFDELGYEIDVGDEDDRTGTSIRRSGRSSKSQGRKWGFDLRRQAPT